MANAPRPKTAAPEMPSLLQYTSHIPDAMMTLARIQGRVMDAMLQQNIQVLDFYKRRFENDRALAGALAKVDDAQGAIAIWGNYWRQAVQDYATEPQQLSRISASAAAEAVKLAREEAAAVMEQTTATAV